MGSLQSKRSEAVTGHQQPQPQPQGDDGDLEAEAQMGDEDSPASGSNQGQGGGGGGGGGRRSAKGKKSRGRAGKRKLSSDSSASSLTSLMSTPKKRRLRTTSEYIYETLFQTGTDHDVVVSALGREWKLHKLYLGQSGYFASMFSGNWHESGCDRVEIGVADPQVTPAAFDLALGSLYQDEVSLRPDDVVPALATATLLSLDGLIAQCVQLMNETINVRTVIKYLEAAQAYGQQDLAESCIVWLRVNLLSHLPEHPDCLRSIGPDLMRDLIASPDLFVMQTEFSAYVLLRLWVFMRLGKRWTSGSLAQDVVLESHRYFQNLGRNEPTSCFLLSDEGKPFTSVFRQLRLRHLVNHHMDMDMLLGDHIIPKSWMEPVFLINWRTLLKMDHGTVIGPTSQEAEDEGTFGRTAMRCGRTLTSGATKHIWRWTGFNMGLDLIVDYNNFKIGLKRNIPGVYNEHDALIATHAQRRLLYRVTAASVNDQKQVTYTKCSGVKATTLNKNETEQLLKLDPDRCTFPLLLSFNFVTVPADSESDQILLQIGEDEATDEDGS